MYEQTLVRKYVPNYKGNKVQVNEEPKTEKQNLIIEEVFYEASPQPLPPQVEKPAETGIRPTEQQRADQVAKYLSATSKLSKTPQVNISEMDSVKQAVADVLKKVNTMSWGGGGTGVVRIGDTDDFDKSSYGEGYLMNYKNGKFALTSPLAAFGYAPLTVSAIGDSFVARFNSVDLSPGAGAAPTTTTINNSYTSKKGAHTMRSPLLHGALRSKYAWSMFEYVAGSAGASSTVICDPTNSLSCLNALYGFKTYLKNTFNSDYGKPDMCLVCAGTNDWSSNIPMSTTLSNLETCYQSLLSNGIVPIAWTLTPNQLAPTYIQRLNQGIIRLALKYNIPVCDAYSAVADAATGMWASSSYQAATNDLHLSAVGAGLVGYALNQAISSYTRQSNRVVSDISNFGTIGYITKTNGGSGYASGTTTQYYNVALTGGSGSGATATFDILLGVVVRVDLNTSGSGYVVGDTLGVSNANLGGTGSGFSCTVSAPFVNRDPNFTSYAGTIDVAASYPNAWDTPATTSMSTICSTTGSAEIGTGKTPYSPFNSAILPGVSARNYCGNAWQLKGNGTNKYGGGSYTNGASAGDRILVRFRVKWLPDLTAGTKGDFRLIIHDNTNPIAGINSSQNSGNTDTCPIGGETDYPAGDFYQVFTWRGDSDGTVSTKFEIFPRLDFINVSNGAPNSGDSLTIANFTFLNLTQMGYA